MFLPQIFDEIRCDFNWLILYFTFVENFCSFFIFFVYLCFPTFKDIYFQFPGAFENVP